MLLVTHVVPETVSSPFGAGFIWGDRFCFVGGSSVLCWVGVIPGGSVGIGPYFWVTQSRGKSLQAPRLVAGVAACAWSWYGAWDGQVRL